MDTIKVFKKEKSKGGLMVCYCPHCNSKEVGFLTCFLENYKGTKFLCESCYKPYDVDNNVTLEA